MRAKIRRFNYKVRHDYMVVENIVLLLAVVLCLMWTYQSIVAMSKNWNLSEELAKERRTLELLSVEVGMAELENEYYKTDEYQELMARRHLEKENYGEKMVVMPENSEIAKNKHSEGVPEETEKEYSNFEKWMRYLFPNY